MKKEADMKIRMYVLFILAASCQVFAEEPWKNLFDGTTLDGWVQLGGKAIYKVQDGSIVGTTVLNTSNSFLCTEKSYADFILELEFKVDPKLNSGVQIRSNSFPEYEHGRVHGYQIEIDPSDRKWTGGIYDEARRGWLYSLEENPAGGNAFRQNEWNKFRIEAIGTTFKTWVNDVPTAHLSDTMTREGFIALQVHSIGRDKSKEGVTVQWRNIRIITESPEKYSMSTPLEVRDMHNKLSELETKAGWKLLFDGRTSSGWRGARLDHFPEQGWKIDNGILTVLESGGAESRAGGDIVTVDKYGYFELAVDFKITPGANSGIKYYVDTELNKKGGSAIGLEYQILDDEKHPDAKLGSHDGSRTLASLYDLIKAENKYPNPAGQWNNARIVAKKDNIEHWLNGRKVLEYVRYSEEFRKLVDESKYKTWPGFGLLPEGEILLQDHGNEVSFRNMKIRRIK